MDRQLYRVVDKEGLALSAHVELHPDKLHFQSRGGTKGGLGERNSDYTIGLKLLLERLADLKGEFVGAWVDSSVVQDISIEERYVLAPNELQLPAEEALELLYRRVPQVGRSPESGSRGNQNKRLLFRFSNPRNPSEWAAFLGLRQVGETTGRTPRIFASAVWGMDFDKWGAWGFRDKGTRDRLAAEIGPDDYVLSIGTTSSPTASEQQGRLLALMRIGARVAATKDLVEPEFYRQSIDDNKGVERWPFGFPIKRADTFDDLPSRRDILPRIDQQNLYMALARHFVELEPEEVTRVLQLPRTDAGPVYSTPRSSFRAHLCSPSKGPPPSREERILSPSSGPAATYVMRLEGAALDRLGHLLPEPTAEIFKVGYSHSPAKRLEDLNRFFPCTNTLGWKVISEQWHDDDINAYSMEQEVLKRAATSPGVSIKGEIIACTAARLEASWNDALAFGERNLPDAP